MGNMKTHLHLGFSLVLLGLTLTGAALTGCADLPITCGVPDSTQACDCSDGRTGGTQTCRNEKWTECVCPGEPIPGTDGSVDGAVDGAAATSGTGGTGGADSGGTGGTGGSDSGTDAGDDAAMIDGGSDAGGTGGTGGSFPAAYTGPCTMNSDCGPDAVCFRNTGMTKSYCAPECLTSTTCPAAPAGGSPTIACSAATLGGPTACQLTCSAFAMCPTGFTCSEPALLPNQCF